MGERLNGIQEVRGSTPLGSTKESEGWRIGRKISRENVRSVSAAEMTSMRFSETHGFRPMRSALEGDSIDPPLRNALWNALLGHVLGMMAADDWGIGWTPARRFAASMRGHPPQDLRLFWA